MTPIRLTRYAIVVAVATTALLAATYFTVAAQEMPARTTLARFQLHVNDYLTLRWKAIRDLPAAPPHATFEQVIAGVEARVRAVRKAREGAKTGAIFTTEIAQLLRATIAFTLEEHGIKVKDLLAELTYDAPPGRRPRVNDRFPWLRGAAMPVVLLEALPPLPDELQYRLVDRDLVLLDIDLALILDIVPNALAEPGGW